MTENQVIASSLWHKSIQLRYGLVWTDGMRCTKSIQLSLLCHQTGSVYNNWTGMDCLECVASPVSLLQHFSQWSSPAESHVIHHVMCYDKTWNADSYLWSVSGEETPPLVARDESVPSWSPQWVNVDTSARPVHVQSMWSLSSGEEERVVPKHRG